MVIPVERCFWCTGDSVDPALSAKFKVGGAGSKHGLGDQAAWTYVSNPSLISSPECLPFASSNLSLLFPICSVFQEAELYEPQQSPPCLRLPV